MLILSLLQTGFYIFLESSRPAEKGDVAIIRSPWIKKRGPICITFSYHMFGVYMGGIRLYALEKRDDTKYGHDMLLWEKFRDQKNIWHTTSINYTIPYNAEVSKLK